MRKFSIAVVGAGPSGYFAAQALQALQNKDIEFSIDIFERLPTPWGLVRSGVAPDHPRIKDVAKVFENIAFKPGVRLLANIDVGANISLDELKSSYDAVVISSGTPRGRELGIPGEKLSNVISSWDFFSWYNGHIDYVDVPVDLSGVRAVVIGVGNVALDVARMLAVDPHRLDSTDIADYALEDLHTSNIREVNIVARRGAECVAFTSTEIRELSNLESTRVLIEENQIHQALKRIDHEPTKQVRTNLEAMLKIAENPRNGTRRSLRLLFEYRPIEIRGKTKIESVIFDTPNGLVEMPCDLLITAIGYIPSPTLGLPVDGNRYLNEDGHIEDNVFVVGWAKRGPNGVIGSNKSDSAKVMQLLVSTLASPKTFRDPVPALKKRGLVVIQQPEWTKINEFEKEMGKKEGRPRVKITNIDKMLEITHENIEF